MPYIRAVQVSVSRFLASTVNPSRPWKGKLRETYYVLTCVYSSRIVGGWVVSHLLVSLV